MDVEKPWGREQHLIFNEIKTKCKVYVQSRCIEHLHLVQATKSALDH